MTAWSLPASAAGLPASAAMGKPTVFKHGRGLRRGSPEHPPVLGRQVVAPQCEAVLIPGIYVHVGVFRARRRVRPDRRGNRPRAGRPAGKLPAAPSARWSRLTEVIPKASRARSKTSSTLSSPCRTLLARSSFATPSASIMLSPSFPAGSKFQHACIRPGREATGVITSKDIRLAGGSGMGRE
jgi:hypothetical protein